MSGKSESTNLSRGNLSGEIGRTETRHAQGVLRLRGDVHLLQLADPERTSDLCLSLSLYVYMYMVYVIYSIVI